jgi:hypothetical protein
MNNQRRPFKNVSELVVCDVKKEISTTAKRYIDLIQEYQSGPGGILVGDVLNGQVSTLFFLVDSENKLS